MAHSRRAIGVFVPPPVPDGENASTRRAGIGRLPAKTHRRVWELIDEYAAARRIAVHRDINFRDTYVYNGRVFWNDLCVCDLDLYFWYSEIDRRANSYDLSALRKIASDTLVVRNPWDYETALDRYTAFDRLRASGVRVPEQILFSRRNLESIRSILSQWKSAVLKPRRGGFGIGVTLVPNYHFLRDVIEYFNSVGGELTDEGFFLEKFYDNDIVRWSSVTVMSGEVIYSFRKQRSRFVEMGAGVFKVYDQHEIGGSVEICELPDSHRTLAVRAAESLKLQIVGFDMIWHDGEPLIVDVNTFPGYYESLFEAVERDPAAEFFRVIRACLRSLE